MLYEKYKYISVQFKKIIIKSIKQNIHFFYNKILIDFSFADFAYNLILVFGI